MYSLHIFRNQQDIYLFIPILFFFSYLSIYLSIYLPISVGSYLYIHFLATNLSIKINLYISIYLSIYRPISVFSHHYIYFLATNLSIRISLLVSIYLSIIKKLNKRIAWKKKKKNKQAWKGGKKAFFLLMSISFSNPPS